MATRAENDLKTGFGFDPAESTHHFVVTIPRSNSGEITISEHLSWDAEKGSSAVSTGAQLDGQVRVVLKRGMWDAIADEMRAELNRRLRKLARTPGSWKTGSNVVRRELGKELVLLAWSIEEADPALIPTALANWRGLLPEERWWLYTQTAAATGHGIADRGRGWRRALRYALTENPVVGRTSDTPTVPEYFRTAAGTLFGDTDDG